MAETTLDAARRNRRTPEMLLFVAAWTVIAIVAATTVFIAMRGSTMGEWLRIFGYMLSYFYAWAIIGIAINWLIHRGQARGTPLWIQSFSHFGFLLIVTILLPIVLHPTNYESWLYGDRAVGFHALNAFIYSFVLISGLTIKYYRMNRAIEESLERSRMEALRAQINPHFLFNALNSIASLVESRKNEAAYDLIARIAELLRHALEFSRESVVTVAREVGFLDSYLAIERVRYPDRLRTRISVPTECLDYSVPSFSLQPLVENVIKHAVSASTEPVTIEVEVACNSGQLTLRVSDDGPGLQAPVEYGVGLGNISKRLRYLYGEAAALTASNCDSGGAVVTLTLPAQKESRQNESNHFITQVGSL